MRRLAGRPSVLGLALAVLLVLPAVANPYLVYVAGIALLYVILAVGLNLLLGYAGQFAFANAALFGIGAYATGLGQQRLGLPFWVALPAGALFTALAGLLVALPALRLSGLYLALATMAFAQFTQWTMLNWESVTFGAGGFKVPPPSFAPFIQSSATGVYYLTLAVTVGLVIAAWNTVRSRVGRALIAVRDSEVAAEALGIDLARAKALAFAMSASYAGVAGGLYSATLNFVAPEGFDLFQMVVHFSMVVVGGLGSVWGAVLGAGLLVGLQEALRAFKGAQEIAFGLVLMATIIFLPDGLVSLLKRRWPGWEEPLRRTTAAGAAPLAPDAARTGDGLARGQRAAGEPVLVVRDLAVAFGGVSALDGVDLAVGAGEIRGIIGPNGAGKTTLLNAIGGFERPARGEIRLAGSAVTGLRASAIAARGLTRTFQTTQLFRGMTVLENVMTGRHLHLRAGVLAAALNFRSMRAEEADAAAAAHRALAIVGMEAFADRAGAELSFGQQRLVEMARALVSEPRVLLLDEPAVGLSPARVAQLDALLRRIRDEHGVTIVMIEHVIRLVMGVSDRVTVLDYGKKIAEGTPEAIRSDPAVIEAYLGKDSMLDVRHLEVSYGPTRVLRDVSFSVAERSIVALLGGNGSGKTTTLNVLSGLLAPQRGTITLDGQRIDGLATDRVVGLGLVQVPQGREVWGGMTVRDNLALGAARRRDRREMADDLEAVFARFPVLRGKQRARAGSLSGGEQQMLAIARALMARPRLLLLDEPSAGLSPIMVGQLVDVVRALHAQGLTILLVEQNVGVAAALAERAHVLVNGEIAVSGPAGDLLTNPDVLASYLGR